MDDDRLTLSPGYGATPDPGGRRERRWEDLDARLDDVAWRQGYDPADRRVRDSADRYARRPRPVLAIFVIGVAAFCIAFVAAPLMAFRAVRSAAEFGDTQALGDLIDYNAVRQSLRTQIRPASAERAPPPDLLHDPLGVLRRAWEPVSPQADIEPYLAPEALAALAEGRPRTDKPKPGGGPFGGPVPAVRYWGFERARLGVRDPGQAGRETIFTFERRKLFTWRLVGLRLPQGVSR